MRETLRKDIEVFVFLTLGTLFTTFVWPYIFVKIHLINASEIQDWWNPVFIITMAAWVWHYFQDWLKRRWHNVHSILTSKPRDAVDGLQFILGNTAIITGIELGVYELANWMIFPLDPTWILWGMLGALVASIYWMLRVSYPEFARITTILAKFSYQISLLWFARMGYEWFTGNVNLFALSCFAAIAAIELRKMKPSKNPVKRELAHLAYRIMDVAPWFHLKMLLPWAFIEAENLMLGMYVFAPLAGTLFNTFWESNWWQRQLETKLWLFTGTKLLIFGAAIVSIIIMMAMARYQVRPSEAIRQLLWSQKISIGPWTYQNGTLWVTRTIRCDGFRYRTTYRLDTEDTITCHGPHLHVEMPERTFIRCSSTHDGATCSTTDWLITAKFEDYRLMPKAKNWHLSATGCGTIELGGNNPDQPYFECGFDWVIFGSPTKTFDMFGHSNGVTLLFTDDTDITLTRH